MLESGTPCSIGGVKKFFENGMDISAFLRSDFTYVFFKNLYTRKIRIISRL